MRKLRAIWNILRADKWAVFTYEEAPEDSEWFTAPTFRWNVSEKCMYFFRLIRERLYCMEEFESKETWYRKVYPEDKV